MSQTPFRNRMKGKVDVWWRKTQDLENMLSVPSSSSVGGYLGMPFRNRMKGNFDILAPTRFVKALNPIHDTFVSEVSPYSIYGRSNNILVGYNNNKKYEGLLKFNIQEAFPVFNKDAYILIDCTLKLTIANTRDIKDGDIDFYEVSLGDWNENSTTWANKPIKSNELTSAISVEGDSGDTGNTSIYVDMNELVPKWLDNPRKNNGIFIETRETIDNIISFYSKENGEAELNPQLIITYIDLNSPFVSKNNYLNSTVSVWENKVSLITSELEVEVRRSTNTTNSELLILGNPGDLLASLEIAKDRLVCELNVISEYVPAELEVYTNDTSRVNSSISVAQINVESRLRISQLYSLEADLKVGKGKYASGFLGINANRIVNKLRLSSMSNIHGQTNTLAVNYISNELYSNYLTSIEGQIVIDGGKTVVGDLEVITNSHLYGDLFYGRFADMHAELDISPYKNLMSELGVKYGVDISNEVSTLSVGYIDNYLRATGSSILVNSIEISRPSLIDGTLNILADYIKGEVVLFDVYNLKSVISVQSWTLDNILRVSYHSDIVSNISVPDSSLVDSYVVILNEHIKATANVYVRENDYLDASVYALAMSTLDGELSFNYGSVIYNDMMVYTDKISVLNAYLEVYNEDWEYEQRRGYGYIM